MYIQIIHKSEIKMGYFAHKCSCDVMCLLNNALDGHCIIISTKTTFLTVHVHNWLTFQPFCGFERKKCKRSSNSNSTNYKQSLYFLNGALSAHSCCFVKRSREYSNESEWMRIKMSVWIREQRVKSKTTFLILYKSI